MIWRELVRGRDMVRRVLRRLKQRGEVKALGRGPERYSRKEVIPLKRGNKEGNVILPFVSI